MTRNWVLLTVCLAGCALPPEVTEEPPPAHPDSRAEGWSELFARDLGDAIAPPGIWSFDGDVLTASDDQAIWTRKVYDDFILDLEFRNAECTNSGVFIHCSDIEGWVNHSLEIQIADNFCEQWAQSPKTWQCGALFGRMPASRDAVKAPGEWNRMTITAQDSMVWVMLNGHQVIEADLTRWTSATTNPDGSEIPPWLSIPLAELPTEGHVGLQGKHAGAPIWFRNLRIRELP